MTRRTWTLLFSSVLVLVLGLLGALVPVPYVALGPGPVYDTLGKVGDTTVVEIGGENTFPTGGKLSMTTVSLNDGMTLLSAFGLWLSGDYALAPRDELFPPEKTKQQIDQENSKAFQDSQTSAEIAALRYLKYPVKVLATKIEDNSALKGILEPGDRVLAVNGKTVATAAEVRAALEGTKPGEQVDVRYQHNADPEKTARVTLGKSDDRPQGVLGVTSAERPDVPFQIKIALKDVGGPSAGLMFALSIVDKLTPGELNGGQSIAGTGEIDADGKVGAIGGIPFKMIAARNQGATAFLVPQNNCAEAKQRAPEGLKLVKVGSLTEAVGALEALRSGQPTPAC
ncbi:PDZ domain-containing protein [Crossiella equi]|uniref:endopeptidase La n=1 Tax=Crossiella equi TaxID=130796 RepID=A0ABS5AJ53_9PSEU|nr:PDZ domain-containing protein [Crossiella equi]MBP2476600.1 PDZ domain-containing protein [Crossiella equi]